MIACVWLPHFATELIRSTDKTLARKSLLLCDPDTTQVVARCRPSMQRGVTLNMPLHAALAAMPDASILSYSAQQVNEAYDVLLKRLRDFTDRIEPVHEDDGIQFYLDLGRLNSKQVSVLGRKIIRAVKQEIDLKAHVGIASNRFTAFAAAYVEDGLRVIPNGSEAGFLYKLPVNWLPLSREHLRRLDLFGIHQIGAFAQLPRYAVQAQFGKEALLAYQLANGVDPRPIQPHIPRRRETIMHSFDDPVETLPRLEHALYGQMMPVFDRLQREGYQIESLTVVFQTDDHKTLEQSRPIRAHRSDAVRRSLHTMLSGLSFHQGVTEFEITLNAALRPAPVQMRLFPDDIQLSHNLTLVAEQIGTESLEEAVRTQSDAPLPEDRFTFRRLA
ncbi:MAG: hypothetical protein AAFV33_15715 [Chloroflexota bacterium]